MINLMTPFILLSIALNQICHTEKGTEYGQKAALAYTETNHGPDGSLFLDPYFKTAIENLDNHKVLDAGCGAAPWSIYAAQNGGQVFALDIQECMIQNAKQAIGAAKIDHKITLIKGDVSDLPFKESFFDRIISICVACNLPAKSFDQHFYEMQRTLKKEGIAVIGGPHSLDVVFTNDSVSDEIALSHIEEILRQLPNDPSSEQISTQLSQLAEIRSATFFIKNHRLTLLTDEKELTNGERIWRKLSHVVVPNHFYSIESYIHALRNHHFDIQRIDLPKFKSEKERINYNATHPESKLGAAYAAYAPFVIFQVKRKEAQVKRKIPSLIE